MEKLRPSLQNMSLGSSPGHGPADYGIMVHYLGGGDSVDSWNARVDSFDVEGLAQDLEEAGAGHLIFTIGQNSGFYAAPNATYDSIVGRTPSRCATRDLVAHLQAALAKRGIRLLVYLPSGAPEQDEVATAQLRYNEGLPRRAEFQKLWEAVIREWSLRWGEGVAGWWFDGCYTAEEMYAHPDPPNFESFAAAARAGNPGASVSFNNGRGAVPMTQCEDCTAGEVWQADRYLPECHQGGQVASKDPVSGQPYAARWHLLTFLAGNFGGFGVPCLPRFSDQYVAAYMARQLATGGCITWDVPVVMGGEENGRLRRGLMPQLRMVKSVLRGGCNLALKRPALASSAFEGAHAANSGDLTASWTSDASDSTPYWQVDLGLAYRLEQVEVELGHKSTANDLFMYAFNDLECRSYDVLSSGTTPPSEHPWTVTVTPPSKPYRFLRIGAPGGTLSLADVRVYGQLPPPVNLALHKPAHASSGSDPALGNNGRLDTDWTADPGEACAWWQVDLGEAYQVTSVELLAKQGSGEEYSQTHFQVWGSDTADCSEHTVLASNGDYVLRGSGLWTASVTAPYPFRFIRVIKTDGNPFFFSEVRVFGHIPLGVCVASEGRPAWASSTWNSEQSAGKATQEDSSTMWAAGPDDSAPWWEVDMGRPMRVVAVEMVPRQDDCDQPLVRSNFEFRGGAEPDGVDTTLLAAQGPASFPYKATWRAPVTAPGLHRYIRVLKSDGSHMNFALIRVWTAGSGSVKGPEVAFGRPTKASSEFSDGTKAAHGNDGDKNTIWASAVGDPQPWWQVDLGRPLVVSHVVLTARQDCNQAGARTGFEVRGGSHSRGGGAGGGGGLAQGGDLGFGDRGTWEAGSGSDQAWRYLRVVKVDGGHFNFCEFRAYASEPFPSKLTAVGKACASSEWNADSCPASAPLDDVSSRIWASAADDPSPWWQVDLEDECRVTGVELSARQDGGQDFTRRNFEVRGSHSKDFASWVLLASPEGGATFPERATWRARVTAPHDPVRYIRVAKTDGAHFNFSAFRAYGYRPFRELLSEEGAATASSVFGGGVEPEKALDGKSDTIWASALEDPQPWWQVALGGPCRVVRVELVARQDCDQDFTRRNFEVRGSSKADASDAVVLATQGETEFKTFGTWSAAVGHKKPFQYLRVVKVDGSHFNFSAFRAFGERL